MTEAQRVTFISHTNKPGGGELALRRYLGATTLPMRLVTLEGEGVWAGLTADVVAVKGVRGLARALRGEKLVVANSMRSAFLTALVLPRQARLVYWVRDGLTDSAMSPISLALTKYVTARRASHYIANSQWTAGTVREALKVRPDQVDVVHSMCGVTETMLDRPPRTKPHTPLRLLFLGRLSPWKGPDVAVRALTKLREIGVQASLTIAGEALFGEDAYAEELRALVEAEPAATLVGHVDDVPALLASHDVLVHCSTRPEPFGQVVVQGLAAGMPVVATDVGGPREILGGAPLRVRYPAGDISRLVDTIEGVVTGYGDLSVWGLRCATSFSDETSRRHADVVFRALQAR